jgi:hypothetical protein
VRRSTQLRDPAGRVGMTRGRRLLPPVARCIEIRRIGVLCEQAPEKQLALSSPGFPHRAADEIAGHLMDAALLRWL